MRELVSNASDAIDKLRFEAISDPALYESDANLGIHVRFDKEARTITISDNGIGMSREEAIRDTYPGWIKTQQVCPVKPLEENFVPNLIALQSRGITVMGLTHRQPSVAQ